MANLRTNFSTGEVINTINVTQWSAPGAIAVILTQANKSIYCGGLFNYDTQSQVFFKFNVAGDFPVSRLTSISEINFKKLVNDFGNSAATITINRIIPITSNYTIPANITLKFEYGGAFNISTSVSLTILGDIIGIDYQIFTGNGLATFSSLKPIVIKAAWYGVINNGASNDILPFIKAINSLNGSGGGTLLLPKKIMLNNTGTNNATRFNQMIVIRTPIIIRPDSNACEIAFNSQQVPLFVAYNTSDISIGDGIQFVYNGLFPTPTAGIATAFINFMGITNYVINNVYLNSVIFIFGTDRYRLSGLSFRSATSDNAHSIYCFINILAKDGMAQQTYGGQINSISIRDFQQGMILCAQNGMTVSGINADYRAYQSGGNAFAPGHVLYAIGISSIKCENCTIQNITEGSNYHAMDIGTVAIKDVSNSVVRNIISGYPEGVVQSIDNCNNVTFEGITWKGGSIEPVNPVINLVNIGSSNCTFRNISLDGGNKFVSAIAFTGANADQYQNNSFENIIIRGSSYYTTDPTGTARIVVNNRGYNNSYKNVVFIPTTAVGSNTPCITFQNFSTSLNTMADMAIQGQNADMSLCKIEGALPGVNLKINKSYPYQESFSDTDPINLPHVKGSIFRKIGTSEVAVFLKTTDTSSSLGWAKFLTEASLNNPLLIGGSIKTTNSISSAIIRLTSPTPTISDVAYIVYFESAGGNQTVALPSAVSFGERILFLKNISSTASVSLTGMDIGEKSTLASKEFMMIQAYNSTWYQIS